MAEAGKTGKDVQGQARRERLAAELRANLGKRKAQARARAAAKADAGVASAHRDAGPSDPS